VRVRTILPWLVLPSLLVAAAACLLVARTSHSDREQTARFAAGSLRFTLLLQARDLIEYEVAELTALGAFVGPPEEFTGLMEASDEYAEFGDRHDTIDLLFETETLASPVLRDLRSVTEPPPPLVQVLSPLRPETRLRIQQGATGFLVPREYVEGMRWLDAQVNDAEQQAEHADRALLDFTQSPPYWRSWEFGLAAAGLGLLAVLGSIVGVWRVSSATRKLGEMHDDAKQSAAAMAARADQLHSLIELGRRLSSDAEPGVIASTIVAEAARVLHPQLCVLATVGEGRVVPVAFVGVEHPIAVSFRDGAIGRAADIGMTVRTIVPSEPMLGEVPGPLSILAVPLTNEGRVIAVLLIARTGSTMFPPDDETVLELVAMMSAGALRVAERYGSTLALALDDPLTGLGNRRRLDRDLGEIGPERGRAVSFLMIDIDFFKQFNDRFGHPAGDALLRDVGDAISGAVRSGDIAYRFGGEEFSVLLPDTDAATALSVAERVRQAVAAIEPPAGTEHITVSVGVCVGSPAMTSSQLIDEADRALYDAKRSGRDRVTFAGAGSSVKVAGTFAPPSPDQRR